MTETAEKQSVILKGIIGSPGACLARAYVFRKRIEVKRVEIAPDQVDAELERYNAAVRMTATDIQNLRRKAEERHGEKYAAIFDSHLLMLEDPQFGPKLVARLKKELVNVESIVRDTVDQLHKAFSAIEDPYLRERAIDIKDVGGRLLRHLMGLQGPAAEIGDEPYVLVAQEVTPSEMLDFAKGGLQGICLDTGGATSHVAILAGALAIPSVFGLSNFSMVARTGDQILLDTRRECRLVHNPDADEIARFNASVENTGPEKVLSDTTADGWRLHIAANIVRSEELPLLEPLKIKRIGLFRSEFIFMESVDLPSEKFQTEVYTRVVEAAPEMAVLRTIDIGSDKPLRYVPLAHEENPAMGFRSVRFSLARPDIFEPQLRAMIRAAQHGNCRIIFPMVSVPAELAALDELYRRIVDEVKPAKVPEWGIMLEVPSAIFMLADIARYTRYISLGTNDLLQFFFAVDRTNEKLAGLGVDEFSMRPAALKNIMALIPQLNRVQVRGIVQSMLMNPPDDHDCRAFLQANFPL